MRQEEKPAYIMAQAVACQCEMEGMKALNRERESKGLSLAYDEQAFIDLPGRYGLHHNQVCIFLES